MPIAPFPSSGGGPSSPTDSLIVVIAGAVLDPAPPTPFVLGHAVGLFDSGGTKTFKLCGAITATQFPGNFYGFLHNLALSSPQVTTGRGSRVVPIVQFGVPLVPGNDVYLSTALGSVTQTAPSGLGQTVLKIGYAVSTTEIVIVTDYRVQIP